MLWALCERLSPQLLAWMLVMAALVAPVADVAVFGIHDHVSASAREQGSLTATTGADLATSHHCELGMSPCVLLDGNALSIPAAVVDLPVAPAPVAASHTPLVPFAPPRL